jgi:hypothetical protein
MPSNEMGARNCNSKFIHDYIPVNGHHSHEKIGSLYIYSHSLNVMLHVETKWLLDMEVQVVAL